MPKLILDLVANAGPSGIAKINENFDRLEDAIENTLSRDGTLPNQMNADLDMNGNDILNVRSVNAESVSVNGQPISLPFTSFKSDWNVSTAYLINDVVRSGEGSLWIAKRSNVGVSPAENDDWTLFLSGTGVADNSITSVKLVNNAVTTLKINDLAVTTAKLEDNSVTSAKITNNPTDLLLMQEKIGVGTQQILAMEYVE